MEGLPELLATIEAGGLGDPLPLLAHIAGQEVELPEGELSAALRRSLLLRAAGGDPSRELDIDERAVSALARELHSSARQAELSASLDRLVLLARGLPHVRAGALFLAGELELAWRFFALGLLAQELGDDRG